MALDIGTVLNGLVVIGIGLSLRILHKMYGDLQTVKSVLGVNGTPDVGLVHEVAKLREAKHEHANSLTALRFEVDELQAQRHQ